MKTTQIQALLLTLLSAASSVSARCYLGESSFDDRKEAMWHAGRACKGYDGNTGALQGWLAPGETKHVCVNSGYGNRYDFTIQNLNRAEGFDLGDDDCEAILNQEIRNCQFGGENTKAGWWFKSDPNFGKC